MSHSTFFFAPPWPGSCVQLHVARQLRSATRGHAESGKRARSIASHRGALTGLELT